MVDYMVVGLGLAGTAFCETLRRNNKTFVVFNDQSQTSSRVAGGLYNPIILKRFTLSWRADEQLAVSVDFYKQLEQFLNIQFDEKLNVLRKFASIEEQNLWFEAADKKSLKQFLVGLANGSNPISIIVPCHRVVGANGSLTGFAGGVETKRWLLDHERRVVGESLDL